MALVLNARGDRRLISNLVPILKWYVEAYMSNSSNDTPNECFPDLLDLFHVSMWENGLPVQDFTHGLSAVHPHCKVI